MTLLALQGSVELGLVYAFLALGIFVSFRILNIPDLTVDGSFTLGAACSAVCTLAGHPFLGLLAGAAAGAAAGFVTAFLQTKMKIQPILAGILTMTGLYSINLRVMENRANLSLLNTPTVFSFAEKLLGAQYVKLLFPLLLMLLVILLMNLFFKTQLGMSIRATGDNEHMVRSSSINADFTKTFGLSLGNAIVGLSGALVAQYNQFSDLNMGVGMVVIAMASLIIGEVIFGSKTFLRNLIAVPLGSIVYRLIVAFVLQIEQVSANDLKLISSIIVVIALSYPVVKQKIQLYRLRKGNQKRA